MMVRLCACFLVFGYLFFTAQSVSAMWPSTEGLYKLGIGLAAIVAVRELLASYDPSSKNLKACEQDLVKTDRDADAVLRLASDLVKRIQFTEAELKSCERINAIQSAVLIGKKKKIQRLNKRRRKSKKKEHVFK